MKTTNVNRFAAEAIRDRANAVLISIRSARGTLPALTRSAWLDILDIAFDDIAVDDAEVRAVGLSPPTVFHAKRIADFIRQHQNSNIVVHCDAGISRSAAVAKVLERLGWRYVNTGAFGYKYANALLEALLKKEFNLT